MAREEADRDDLMREITALSPRIELILGSNPAAPSLVAGRRRDGAISLYFGADPVYHFNATGHLRRAFVAGLLYRSQGTTLAQLERVRTERETQLLRHDLNSDELNRFLAAMHHDLALAETAFESAAYQIVEQIPSDANFLAELVPFLNRIKLAIPPLTPAVKK